MEQPPLLAKGNTRGKAWSYLIMNLFLWPGLGMVLAKKKVGYVQMTLSGITGGGLIVAMIWYLATMFQNLDAPRPGFHSAPGRLGIVCLLLFALSWIWSFITSLQLIRDTPSS